MRRGDQREAVALGRRGRDVLGELRDAVREVGLAGALVVRLRFGGASHVELQRADAQQPVELLAYAP